MKAVRVQPCLILAVALGAPGCKGATSTQRLIPGSDDSLLRLESVSPATETDVVSRPTLTFQFNQRVDPSTIEEGFEVLGSGSRDLAAVVAIDDTGTQITIEPSAALATPEILTINVLDTLRSEDGEAFDKPGLVGNWNVPVWFPLGSPTVANGSLGEIVGDPSGGFYTFGIEQNIAAGATPRTWDAIVSHYDGVKWSQLGTSVDNVPANNVDPGDILLASDGNPFVLWREVDGATGSALHYVKKWTGSSWQSIGGSVGSVNALGGRLELLDDGEPLVALLEEKGGLPLNTFLYRWTGVAWQEIATIGRGFPTTSHAIERQGSTLYVASLETNESQGISSLQLAQVDLESGAVSGMAAGPTVLQGAAALSFRLAMRSNGKPVVAVSGFRNGTWDAEVWHVPSATTTWQKLGTSLEDSPSSKHGFAWDLVLDDNESPWVSFREDTGNTSDMFVSQWDANTTKWVRIGGAVDIVPNHVTHYSRLVTDASHRPAIAFVEHAVAAFGPDCQVGSPCKVEVRRLNKD